MPETIKKPPMRRCIGCRGSYPQKELIRFVFADGGLKIDEEKKADGRGSYICRKKECFEKAVKSNAFSKTFRTFVAKDEIEKIGRIINA